MIGCLLDHWKYTWPDIWSVLTRSRRAPPDLFVELYRTISDYLQNPPEYKKFELITNDPVQARQTFEQIRADDLCGEVAVIAFMESAFDTIGEFEIPRYEKLYRRLVKTFIQKYNLRYRIDGPFRLRLVLPGVFAGFYENLTRVNRSDPHLKDLMNNFELTFGTYARSMQAHDLNACISNAFIYAEGLAAKTSGRNESLGDLCDCLQCWPHTTVRESLKKLYGFRSDFPGLGHAGNPKGKLRDLEPKDAIAICLILLSFSGYLSSEVRMEDALTH